MVAITVSPHRPLILLALVAGLELALGWGHAMFAAANGLGLRDVPFKWINIDGEPSLNAWFTSVLLLGTAALMLWAFAAERQEKRPTAFGWLALAIGFAYLSLDEMTTIHEHLRGLTLGIESVWPVFAHRWVIVGLPLVLAIGLLFVPFLIGLPRATALRLLLAGAVYVGGALGLELVNGAVLATERTSPLYLSLVCLEETLEVTGVLLAIYAVAFHLRKELGAPSLRLG